MRAPISAIGMILATVSAGCLGGADQPLPSPTEGNLPVYDANTTFEVPYGAAGCREGMVVILVTFAQAQKALPAGFKAKDAQGLLELPIPAGKAAMLINANGCTTSQYQPGGVDEATVSIYVDTPGVQGISTVDIELYEAVRWTSHDESLHLFRSLGWNVLEGSPTVALQFMAAGGGVTGNGDVKNEEGIVQHTFGITAPQAESVTAAFRFWHDTPAGIAYAEYKATAAGAKGTGSCSLRTGPAKALVGLDACVNGDTFSLAFPNFKWEAKIVNLPGAKLA